MSTHGLFGCTPSPHLYDAFKKVVNDGVKRVAADLWTSLNRMPAEFRGQPAEAIKPEPQQRCRRAADGEITEPELSEYAEMISAGERLWIDPGRACSTSEVGHLQRPVPSGAYRSSIANSAEQR